MLLDCAGFCPIGFQYSKAFSFYCVYSQLCSWCCYSPIFFGCVWFRSGFRWVHAIGMVKVVKVVGLVGLTPSRVKPFRSNGLGFAIPFCEYYNFSFCMAGYTLWFVLGDIFLNSKWRYVPTCMSFKRDFHSKRYALNEPLRGFSLTRAIAIMLVFITNCVVWNYGELIIALWFL